MLITGRFSDSRQVEYLNAYLQERRQSGETITDESPLIRDAHKAKVLPVSPGPDGGLSRSLCQSRANPAREKGETSRSPGPFVALLFFRAQTTALGVNPEYAEFMRATKVRSTMMSKARDMSSSAPSTEERG